MPTRTMMIALSIAILSFGVANAADRWLHVRVDGGTDDDIVRVNLPLETVASMLPAVQSDAFHEGRLHLDDDDLDGVDLRAMLEVLRDADDGEFVTVRDAHDSVRVAKESGNLIVRVEDRGDGLESVRVQVPMAVVEALLSGTEEGGGLNIAAALDALAELGATDLVSIRDGDEVVRIWIDDRESIDD